MIIGRPDIIKHELLYKSVKHFGASQIEKARVLESNQESDQLLFNSSKTIQSTLELLNMHEQPMSWFFEQEESTDGIAMRGDEEILEGISDQDVDNDIPTKIYGSDSFQKLIRDLCYEYKDIFSKKLKPEPADLPPMDIKVNLEKWRISKNRGPPRVQSTAKQKELLRQINEMSENKIIQPSLASEYSHPLLTPKPEEQWRF